jgi:hypothetical protein
MPQMTMSNKLIKRRNKTNTAEDKHGGRENCRSSPIMSYPILEAKWNA